MIGRGAAVFLITGRWGGGKTTGARLLARRLERGNRILKAAA